MRVIPAAVVLVLAPLFTSIEDPGPIDCGDCMRYEREQDIYIARGMRISLDALWPRVKRDE